MTARERALQIEQLHELGLALLRQRLRRENPNASEASIEARLLRNLLDREAALPLTKARDLPLRSSS